MPHFGLPIFAENKILMLETSASERNLQDAALLISKQLAEFWFGNFVTFKWWNEVWLQEALGDFFKYLAVDQAYPDFRIVTMFIIIIIKENNKNLILFNKIETTIYKRRIDNYFNR